MKKISCLLLSPDPGTARDLDVLCKQVGTIDLRWRAGSFSTGMDIARNHLPEMAIVAMGDEPAAMIESIRAMAGGFPSLYILALFNEMDAGMILGAMRAGAHDVLGKPLAEPDLRAAAEKILKLKLNRKDTAATAGRILSVFSNKGGNGTTTIAANLADALVHQHGKKTVVVDLVMSHGDLTMLFNVNPNYSLQDLARNVREADYDFLHTLLVRHASGVYVLADPPVIEEAEQIGPADVKAVLSTLRSMFDFIVVDTPHQFDERTLTALEMSDIVILLSLMNLPSLKNTQRCLDLFERIGLKDERVRLVLNRSLPDDAVSIDSIEGVMKCPVFFSIPNDYPTVISSVNRGRLLREIAPEKEVTRSIRALAERLLGNEAAPHASRRKPTFIGKIFRSERARQ